MSPPDKLGMAEAQAALAAVLQVQGSQPEAEGCWGAALTARESILGLQHPLSLSAQQGTPWIAASHAFAVRGFPPAHKLGACSHAFSDGPARPPGRSCNLDMTGVAVSFWGMMRSNALIGVPPNAMPGLIRTLHVAAWLMAAGAAGLEQLTKAGCTAGDAI